MWPEYALRSEYMKFPSTSMFLSCHLVELFSTEAPSFMMLSLELCNYLPVKECLRNCEITVCYLYSS